MAAESSAQDLVRVVALLGSAVVAVPIFRRIGLGSVLGYLAAGLAIGPFGLGWFNAESIIHTAELGVVMFLFVIGLEMRPRHLWSLRKEIFGLGLMQVAAATVVLWPAALALGMAPEVALIGALGFVLTSTAIVMQLLAERGDVALPPGQRVVSILLFEDLLVVPLLALVALMSPIVAPSGTSPIIGVLIGIGALAGLIATGIWLLNPLFKLLALAKAREVMTAAALLVVLGAALVMELGGLSMALGAFLAGVLLSESTFRHQIEADIEPFRGILLGLFFLGVGMSLDLAVVAACWPLVVGGVLLMMVVKGIAVYAVARHTKMDRDEAIERATLMAQGGEFAFVLFAAATDAKVIAATDRASLTAIVVLSMVLTPLVGIMQRRMRPKRAPSLEGVEVPDGLTGSVLLIGFGRFGQVASQALLARGVDVTIIDFDIEMAQAAELFGFKVYYGDGSRLDVLHASGAGSARAIVVAIDKREATNKIVELCKAEFPQARVLARSYDREHSLKLVQSGVDFQIRETFESAVRFGQAALRELGVSEQEAQEIADNVRRLDAERFELELADGTASYDTARAKMYGNAPKPTPFTTPKREGQVINEDELEAKAS